MFESIQKTVIETVASHLGMNPEDITPDTSLTTDLKVDSLDFVEICIELEDNYGITFDVEEMGKSMSASTTINDVVEYLISLGATE
jgi:acyl carrier protein